MNRTELEQKTKSIAQNLATKIQESPIPAALVFVALGFVVGVFRGITIPLLLLVGLVYGVVWLLDGWKAQVSDESAKKEDEGENLH